MKYFFVALILCCCIEKGWAQCATTPTITSFLPASGPQGTTVTITGTNFDPVAANNKVFFGNVIATPFSGTGTSLQVTVPVGATSQYFAVNRSCGATAMLQYGFHVTNACAGPLISGVSFAPAATYTADNRGYSAALGDLDGDGKPELAIANYIAVSGNPKVSLFQNLSSPGTLNFSSKTDYDCAGQLYGVYFFDVDMDGKLDLVGQATGNNIFVFRNISTIPGTISLAPKVTVTTTNGSWAITFADMDNDGKPDLVWGGFSTAIIARNLSTPGNISFGSPFTVTTQDAALGFCNTTDVKVADLDLDGKNDIITAGYNCGYVGIARNTSSPGSFSFQPPINFDNGGQNHGIAVGDLNGDGRPEIVAANRSVSLTRVYENISVPNTLSAASFAAPVDLPVSGSSVLIEDLNGDGKPEILIAPGGGVYVYPNNYSSGAISTASFGTAVSYSLSCGGTARMFQLGDADGDGYIDLVSGRDAGSPNAKGEVIRRIPAPNFTALVPVTTTGITNFCNDLTWKYFYNLPGNDKLLAAVKDNAVALGTVTANAYADAVAGNYNGQRYMRRHYAITSTTTPVSTIRVRLYYTTADFNDLKAAIPSLNTASQLAVTHYTGPGEDGVYNPQPTGALEVILPAQITTGTAFGQNYLEFNVNALGEFWIHTGSYILPVQSLRFNAAHCGEQVCLQWYTDNEQDVDRYVIEKSFNGIDFSTVKTVAAYHLLQNNYNAADNSSAAPVVYYRLKQLLNDGSARYSQQIKLSSYSSISTSLLPNPVKNRLTVTTPAILAAVQLTNTAGQIIKSWKPAADHQYDLSSFADGLYYLVLSTSTGTITEKIMIAH